MNDANWEKVKTIFFAALDLPPAERVFFLDAACAGEAELRGEVESLLAAHEAPGAFIDRPAIAEAAEGFVQKDELRAGQQVGPYLVTRKLGQGGMGLVYLARDTRLGRPVALKLLHADFTRDAARVRRFQQEARAASALNHPNILTIYDVGQIDGQDYIATEFIEGQTLRESLSGGPMAPRDALNAVSQVAHALEAAHGAGLAHRDIKPENLMLRRDGFVKVLDFGLVKLVELEPSLGGTRGSDADLSRTNPGAVLGTVSYMSPEQALGQEVDRRSDIFSLGVVFYELLTGVLPFKGDRTAAILNAIIHHDPAPVTTARGDLPLALDGVIARALVKDRELRYQTASDLRADLKRLQRELDLSSTRPPASARRLALKSGDWQTKAVLAAVIIALLAATGFLLWLTAADKPAGRSTETLSWGNASTAQLTDYAGEELFPHLAPDGKSFVYVRAAKGNWDIYQQRVIGSVALNLTANSPEDDYHPTFSPDGEQIAFRSERKGGGLFVMGVLGESVRQIADVGYYPTWSRDGQEIVCSTVFVPDPAFRNLEGRLFAIDLATGARREIVTGHDAVQPHWSPGGARIVYWSNDKNSQRDIWTVSSRGGDPVRLTNDAELDWNPVWSPDGRFVYFISKRRGTPSLWQVPLDESSGQALGAPEAVTGPLAQIWQMSFSRDGRRLIYAERLTREHLQTVNFDSHKKAVVGQPVSIVEGSKQAIQPDLSPDGQWLVYVLISGAQEDLFVVKTDGTMPSRVTNDQHRDWMPRWAPDGKRIIFYSNATGSYEIWAINPDGSGRQQISFSGKKGVVYPSWSPDGNLISFCFFSEQTYLLDAGKQWAEQTPSPLPPLNASGDWFIGSRWSPDGKRIAGWRGNSRGQYPGVYLYSVAAQQYEQVSDVGLWPSWFDDNRRLVCLHDGKLFLVDSQTKRAREIFSLPGRWLNHPVVAHDGRRIYYSALMTESDIHLLTLD